MSVTGVLWYLCGGDVLQKAWEREDALKHPAEEKAGHPLLPLECGLETMVEIYALRARTMVQYSLTVWARITGIEYVYRTIMQRR
ncbi:hypothetical protein HYS48_00045 [Candidatus Woesearchaeota archaeon]|nr:hypothetical protein [Candidatus Woesearchaeota archaeon]